MATANCILFQSLIDSGAPVQQLSNLSLSGLVTINSFLNSDSGKLYGSLTYSSPTYTVSLYKDAGRSQLVASGTATATGLMTLAQANNSGLSGSVNLISYTANDSKIEALCFLSHDSDLPMDNLESTSDYDPIYGFSRFHNEAFEYVKNVVVSRFESILYNRQLIDSKFINGGTGGFDLSRILNWQSPDLREASALYAFYLIARKQSIEPGSIFCERSKNALNRVTALLQSVEIQFDENMTRTPTKTRSMATFKMGRS